jgi:uncharacterized protein GlcG (DUF336 family)
LAFLLLTDLARFCYDLRIQNQGDRMSRSKTLVLAGLVVGSLVTALLISLPANLAVAQDAPAAKPEAATVKDITLEQARVAIQAAVKKAAEINTKMDIAIVDAGGNLKGFARMDGAWLGSIDISMKKAKTARFFDMNTGEIGKLSQPGQPLYQIEVSNGGLITFPGGVPIKAADGAIIGAIGVSGSTVENDHTVAQAGADVLK